MKFTKLLLSVAGATALTLALAGCGSSSSSSGNGKTTVQFLSTKTENASTYKELIKEFEKKNPKIDVEFSSPTNAATLLKTDLTKGTFPDVVGIGGDATFVAMQDAKVFKDLSKESYVKTVDPTYQKMITSLYSGKGLYAVPYATNASGIIYNKSLFKKAGITKIPTTWDELMADAKTLKSKGITPFGVAFKDSWTTLSPWNQIVGNVIPDSWIKTRLNNKSTFAATHKAALNQWLEPLKYAQKDYMGTSYNDINRDFANGKVAMIINGNYEIPEITKLNKDIDADMFMFPVTNSASDNHVVSGIDVAFGIYNKTKVSSAANKLVAFLMQKSSAEKYTQEQFSFSAIDGVKQTSKLVAGISPEIEKVNVKNYPDHYYPSAFDMSKPLTQSALNASKGMSASQNVKQTLQNIDNTFNTANVKNK
ncbi:MAG: extracellular solute-binding protein [Schleiferilactobacillus harbinensis]|jgi:raffinose/stachyose/melibiose transport system substrate-binding protein|uniref:Extracellular solute-binding protein family 1 n=1 Tax=Schleiferilactobacillus perolens DSM 12744 TaxID=1423792 RepID=A0A0R1N390_9LACO|nr:extracellular solute-binding protein [Schleiferilactobacillus perolens]KRL14669.1 extracellular solute-binding protein family 1 [Schleiferilactobacillus perolens DSM 12744]MCI1890643.1 extracellular solute-binding protein [Schleiferilactobacillus harbinensis]MCI1912571.1 extracellular solute-binding protein [Schleiferilactobacillus harbinensis]